MFDRIASPRGARKAPLRIAGLAGLAAGAAMLAASAASAQAACLSHDKLVQMLSGKYSENPVAEGLEAGGRLFQVFAADDGATWTMVVTTPDGASCVVAVGEEWQEPMQTAFDSES